MTADNMSTGKWTQFHDMHSGGCLKLQWSQIFIEAPRDEAERVFYAKFKRNPHRVTCTYCGPDYSISEATDLAQATGYERHLRCVETKRDPATGLYMNDDPNVRYLEEGEEPPPGYSISEISLIARKYGKQPMTLAEYLKTDGVLVVRAEDIGDDERKTAVPEEGYVWAGG